MQRSAWAVMQRDFRWRSRVTERVLSSALDRQFEDAGGAFSAEVGYCPSVACAGRARSAAGVVVGGIVRQYYEAPGAPMVVPATAEEVTAAWVGHRERLRGWLRSLPDDAWTRPTRCSEWTTTGLVEHLISGSQFLGYTLHQAKKGEATRLLAEFDPQQSPRATAAMFSGVGPSDLLDALDEMDGRVAHEFAAFSDRDWLAPAEAPLGRVSARMSVNHFLFDSWVHERDLLLPAGEVPLTEPGEAAAVVSYVAAIAGAARFEADDREHVANSFDITTTDADLCLHVERDVVATVVAIEPGPTERARLVGPVGDIVDYATGRTSGDRLSGDPPTLDFLRNLAVVMG